MKFKFIKKYFSIKVHSLEEFIGFIERKGGTVVIAEPYRFVKEGLKGQIELLTGSLAEITYATKFRSETKTGRSIVFNEVHGTQLEDIYKLHGDKRNVDSLKGLLTVDNRLQRIKERLPYIETRFIFFQMGGGRGTMDETIRQRMYEDAKRLNVTPYE